MRIDSWNLESTLVKTEGPCKRSMHGLRKCLMGCGSAVRAGGAAAGRICSPTPLNSASAVGLARGRPSHHASAKVEYPVACACIQH